jgi:glycosyltransferase involved in cell wall biosynthesis
LAVELGIADRTRLLGRVDDDELHRWMRTAHVMVSMSEREAFGMAPIEAACAGARIILSDIPAHRDVAAKYLPEGCTLIADPTPRGLGEELCRQLAAPRATTSAVPDWRDVVEQTVEIYSAAGWHRAAPNAVEKQHITSASRVDAQCMEMTK